MNLENVLQVHRIQLWKLIINENIITNIFGLYIKENHTENQINYYNIVENLIE